VLSGRGLCDELITRPEESYRLWCVVVCDLETSRMRRPWPALGRSTKKKWPSRMQVKMSSSILTCIPDGHYHRVIIPEVVLTHWGRGHFKLFKRPFPEFLTILTL